MLVLRLWFYSALKESHIITGLLLANCLTLVLRAASTGLFEAIIFPPRAAEGEQSYSPYHVAHLRDLLIAPLSFIAS